MVVLKTVRLLINMKSVINIIVLDCYYVIKFAYGFAITLVLGSAVPGKTKKLSWICMKMVVQEWIKIPIT